MALKREEKNQIVKEVSELFEKSKITILATYRGTPVKSMQQLRRQSKDSGTTLKVVKNRLAIQAIKGTKSLAETPVEELKGMLLYAFNETDEVAPARSLADFAKKQPTIEFVGAISADGKFLPAEEVKALSALPSKGVLIAQVIDTLLSPLNSVTNALSGNLHGLLDGVEAKAK
jgi:large subunit ribosomal protein L10